MSVYARVAVGIAAICGVVLIAAFMVVAFLPSPPSQPQKAVIVLEPFEIRLADREANRYLLTNIVLVFEGEIEFSETDEAVVRELITQVFSQRTSIDLIIPEGRWNAGRQII